MWCARGATSASATSRSRSPDSSTPHGSRSSGGATSSTPAPRRLDLSMDEVLSRKYGMSPDEAVAANQRMTELAATVGLEYHLDRVQIGNTFDAHRLVHLASARGSGRRHEGAPLACLLHRGALGLRPATLAELAADVGLDPDRVAEVLEGDEFADDVRADEARALDLGSTVSRSSSSTGGSACRGRHPPTSCSACCSGPGTPRPRRSPTPPEPGSALTGPGTGSGTPTGTCRPAVLGCGRNVPFRGRGRPYWWRVWSGCSAQRRLVSPVPVGRRAEADRARHGQGQPRDQPAVPDVRPRVDRRGDPRQPGQLNPTLVRPAAGPRRGSRPGNR